MATESRLTVVLVVVVGVLALVSIIVSAVAIARSGGPSITIQNSQPAALPMQGAPPYYSGAASSSSRSPSRKVYVMAIGHDYGAHEYFDTKGYLKGFGLQIADLVCKEAMIDCRVIWDPYENCWQSIEGQRAAGGKGLHDHWYDACTGWYTTVERIHVFQFSQPYLKSPAVYFYKKPGSSFTVENLKGKKIIFIRGWASDEKCVYREANVKLTAADVYYAASSTEAIAKLDDEYVAIFTTATTMLQHEGRGVEKVTSHTYSCMLAGSGIMTRKDIDFTSYWNSGFNKVRSNGEFLRLCERANNEHGEKGKISCVES